MIDELVAFNVYPFIGMPIVKHRQLIGVGAPGAYTSLEPTGVGDCFRACLATILGARRIADVPHFAWQRNIDEYHAGHVLPSHDVILARRWLRDTHGIDLVHLERAHIHPDTHWIATVRSKRRVGAGHAVVGRGNTIIFDPSSADTGHCIYTVDDIDPEDTVALVLCEMYDPDPDAMAAFWTSNLDDTEGL